MQPLSKLSIFWATWSHRAAGFLTGIFLSIFLIMAVAACSGGAAAPPASGGGEGETAAVQPPEATAIITAEEEDAKPADAAPAEPAAVEPTEVPQEPAIEPVEALPEPAAAPSGPAVTACDVLTAAEAEAYLGEAPGAPESPVQGSGIYHVTSCTYATGSNKLGLIITESIDKDPRIPAAAFESDLPKSVENFGVEAVLVPGLGDQAAWISNPDWYVNNLDIVKGIYRIYLSTGGGKSEQPPPALVDVARMVLDELP